MKIAKRIIIITLTLVCLVTISYFLWTKTLWKTFSCSFAGSYECSETWTINANEDSLIKIIEEIKVEHPELKEPNTPYSTNKLERYWYHVTFYYSDTNQDVYTSLRSSENNSYTTLALIGMATHIDSLTPIKDMKMDRKEINRDFEYYENKREIAKFEDKIVKRIIEKIIEHNKKK